MAEDDGLRFTSKRGTVTVQLGQPLQFAEDANSEAAGDRQDPKYSKPMARALLAYNKAARQLLGDKHAVLRDVAPAHLRKPCNILVLQCADGVLVRYDIVPKDEAKARFATTKDRLAQIAPWFSDQVLHFPDDPTTYTLPAPGPELVMGKTDATGVFEETLRFHPVIIAKTALPDGFEMPKPPARPILLVAVDNDFAIQTEGRAVPIGLPPTTTGPDIDKFITYSRFRLPVGWQRIEVYPLLADEYWVPEYAPMWAELDLMSAVLQRNQIEANLRAIDDRGTMRKKYAALLDEFEALLAGPEEPMHQFLKQHPELICPTTGRWWSKLRFGDRVSDFVFCEANNDYLLVEIEAPIRELFRQDGQQREPLTHAINQISDWIGFISRNRERVEKELDLVGISANPRALVVIGRSASLTPENHDKLVTIQAQYGKLRILTYDDLLAAARANLERLLGPLTLKTENAEVYFFK